MTPMTSMRYARRLSADFCDLLAPHSGSLAFLLTAFREWVADDRFALDVQFREGDLLTYYHGTTALLTVRLDPVMQTLRLCAANAYCSAEGYARVCQTWRLADAVRIEELLPAYVRSAVLLANNRYYANRAEGFWQNRLALGFGIDWNPSLN